VASPLITVVDDPLIPRALGSRPCDGEGVRSRLTSVIEKGRLASFLVGGYSARRLKHPYTGHEGGTSNLRLLPGESSLDDLLRQMGTGLLVTKFNAGGVDLPSGSLSKGASGFWVENGAIVHPVQEITVAGNLKDLLRNIRAVGNDPMQQTSVSSPSLLLEGVTVGGK
jgi:PmbA protein